MPRGDRVVADTTRRNPRSTDPQTALGLLRREGPREARERFRDGASRMIGAPERALWAAILSDAVAICLGRTSASPEESARALRWIEEASRAFAGFAWCCDLLRLDDSAIRRRVTRGLKRLRPERRRSLAAWPFAHRRHVPRKLAEIPRRFSAARF